MSDWVDELFTSGLYLKLWPETMDMKIGSARTIEEVDAVLGLLQPESESHILDWCGGYGRHSIELAQRGFQVTLLDYTEKHLELAQAGAEEHGVEVELIRADFRQTPPGIGADYAINLFTSGIGYYEEEDDLAALRSLHATLAPGAKILIDTMSLFWIVRNFRDKGWIGPDDRSSVLVSLRTFDPMTGRLQADEVFKEPGQEDRHFTTDHIIYSPERLARVIGGAGFEVIGLFGSLAGEQFSFDSKRLVMVGQKA